MGQKDINRRLFLKSGASLAGMAMLGYGNTWMENGELLYNGIQLPAEWPPRNMKADDYEPMPLPYLTSPPGIIPIDIGRQLFTDDFLIEKTDLIRRFHQPVKFEGNPVLKPETTREMNEGYCPVAAPFSDGVFYDPTDQLFKLWYMAGWFDGTALATSPDGIHWTRPMLDVVPGTNLVLPVTGLRRDGASVWLDHACANPQERFKMYWFARRGAIGGTLQEDGGYLLTSADGIHWTWRGKIGPTGDNTTFFYNSFRKKWVFTVRRQGRPVPPLSNDRRNGEKVVMGRARSYWENDDFFAALRKWEGYDPVFWLGADKYDQKKSNYSIGTEPQLYKVDAVAYESLMLGLMQVHYGPSNADCGKGGFPKLTELQIAFSRDGFHWDRTNRDVFIGGTLQTDSWERAYVHSVGGVCNIVNDKLYFYYAAFQGDPSNRNRLEYWSGMYAKASTGLAVLRRDGFASMEAGPEERMLCTCVITFTGKYLFVNVEALKGELVVLICDKEGQPLPGLGREQCVPVSGDSTKQLISWKGNQDLASLKDIPIRLKFYLVNARIYSFWVSKHPDGRSGGATAGGGPGLNII